MAAVEAPTPVGRSNFSHQSNVAAPGIVGNSSNFNQSNAPALEMLGNSSNFSHYSNIPAPGKRHEEKFSNEIVEKPKTEFWESPPGSSGFVVDQLPQTAAEPSSISPRAQRHHHGGHRKNHGKSFGEIRGESIWMGCLNFGEGRISTVASLAVGNGNRLAEELPDILAVVGHIGPKTVCDYVEACKNSQSKNVVVIQFHVPQNSDDRRQYLEVFKFMHEKRRFHVVGNCNPKFIKDFYVFPLAEGEKLHRVMRGSESDPGVDSRHPHLIMGKKNISRVIF